MMQAATFLFINSHDHQVFDKIPQHENVAAITKVVCLSRSTQRPPLVFGFVQSQPTL